MIYMLLPLVGGGWMGVSCSDWDDHYDGAQTGSDQTLWQQMLQSCAMILKS